MWEYKSTAEERKKEEENNHLFPFSSNTLQLLGLPSTTRLETRTKESTVFMRGRVQTLLVTKVITTCSSPNQSRFRQFF